MSDDEERQASYIAALVELHRGLARQGPGDAQFMRDLLRRLTALPARPRIADLGCGSGAATLLLAQYYQSRVRAVDASPVFIAELRSRAVEAGLDRLVEPICADMAALDWPSGSIDLLWSEGAAYALGFERALRCWRRLLAAGGVAVVSETSWFAPAATVPAPLQEFWRSGYPEMGDERENTERARAAGFAVVFTQRLPSAAWWRNYYGPLRERIRSLRSERAQPAAMPQTQEQPTQEQPTQEQPTQEQPTQEQPTQERPTEAWSTGMQRVVLQETEQEMSLFERYSDYYGYTFYVLAPSGPDRR